MEQAVVSDLVPVKFRTSLTALLGAFAVLGFTVGPMLGAPLSMIRVLPMKMQANLPVT